MVIEVQRHFSKWHFSCFLNFKNPKPNSWRISIIHSTGLFLQQRCRSEMCRLDKKSRSQFLRNKRYWPFPGNRSKPRSSGSRFRRIPGSLRRSTTWPIPDEGSGSTGAGPRAERWPPWRTCGSSPRITEPENSSLVRHGFFTSMWSINGERL